jgi:hypothetical protein
LRLINKFIKGVIYYSEKLVVHSGSGGGDLEISIFAKYELLGFYLL